MRELFWRVASGNMAVAEFEQWVYANLDELEQRLSPDDYLGLISLGFNTPYARRDLKCLLGKYVDFAEFAPREMLALLEKAKRKTPELPQVLMDFYDLYCDGYYFLQTLALDYGLNVYNPRSAKSWEALNAPEQDELLGKFYPELTTEVERIISLIEDKTIIPLGERKDDDLPRLNYLGDTTQPNFSFAGPGVTISELPLRKRARLLKRIHRGLQQSE